jgi:hypothetical protein
MSLTKLSLGGNYDVIYTFFLPRESLVSDIPAGDGNIKQLFLQCDDVCQPFRLLFIIWCEASVRLFGSRDMLLLAFTFLYTGLQLNILSAVYATCLGFTQRSDHRGDRLILIIIII